MGIDPFRSRQLNTNIHSPYQQADEDRRLHGNAFVTFFIIDSKRLSLPVLH